MKKVKVGVIGLGEVAQMIHLPILQSLSDRYEIAALCDVSPQLLELIGEEYGVNQQYADAHKLTKQDNLDAVFVLNSDEYHAECAVSAAENKKHVFIEKPMCLTFAEADAIIKARDQFNVKILVGYMRRFAPAYLKALEEVKTLGTINYARVRDIIGANRLFIEQSHVVHTFNDIPKKAKKDKAERAEKLVKEAIGSDSEERSRVYRYLCGLSSHDLSAMRGILGFPKSVVTAQKGHGSFLTVIFEYEGFTVTFETGTDEQRRFDAHIEIYGQQKSLKIQYNTPYIRHLPTTLSINETINESYRETTIRPTFKDPYTFELEHFSDVVTKGIQPRIPPEDFKEDLQLFKMIIEQL